MKKNLLLILIIALGFLFRIYKVDVKPSGVLVDEAAIGYNSYSMAVTGHDEHGLRYPLLFKSFGDFKPPAYFYADAVFTKLLGSNNLSLRLPSVLAGVLLIPVIYLITIGLGLGYAPAIFASALTAFSPWTVYMSRFALESNLALLIFSTGLLFVIRSLKSDKLAFPILAGFFLGLSWYGYIAYRLSSGVLIAFIFIYFFRRKVDWKKTILMSVVFFIVASPFILTVFSKSTSARFYQIGLLADQGPVKEIVESRNFCREDFSKIPCYLAYNKVTVIGRILFERYMGTFSPDYLFIKGEDNPGSYGIENFGHFAFFLIPLYLCGIFLIFSKKDRAPFDIFVPIIFFGLFASPLPSAIVSIPQKIRLTPLFPFLAILIILGFDFLLKRIRNRKIKLSFILISILSLFVWGAVFTVNFMTLELRKNETRYGNYIRELMAYLETKQNSHIYMNVNFAEPLIYYAYFSKYDPDRYLSDVQFTSPDGIGWIHAKKLGKIEVIDSEKQKGLICDPVIRQKGDLLVTSDRVFQKEKDPSIVYNGRTGNGAMSLVYVYDIGKIPSDQAGCETNGSK